MTSGIFTTSDGFKHGEGDYGSTTRPRGRAAKSRRSESQPFGYSTLEQPLFTSPLSTAYGATYRLGRAPRDKVSKFEVSCFRPDQRMLSFKKQVEGGKATRFGCTQRLPQIPAPSRLRYSRTTLAPRKRDRVGCHPRKPMPRAAAQVA